MISILSALGFFLMGACFAVAAIVLYIDNKFKGK